MGTDSLGMERRRGTTGTNQGPMRNRGSSSKTWTNISGTESSADPSSIGMDISRPQSRTSTGKPVVIVNLLQRARGRSPRHRHTRTVESYNPTRSSTDLTGEPEVEEAIATPNASSIPQPLPIPQPRLQRTRTEAQRQPRLQVQAPAPAPATATYHTMAVQSSEPQLKKKPSLRDRLKSWQKPVSTPAPIEEESKPRFVYQPKHAAADFSRLGSSPPLRRAHDRSSFDQDDRSSNHLRERRRSTSSRTSDADVLRPDRISTTGLQTLVENEAVQTRLKRQSKHHVEVAVKALPTDQKRLSREESRRSASKRHSYAMVQDPWEASQKAIHVPINTAPVTWSPAAEKVTRHHSRGRKTGREEARDAHAPQPTRQLSDYELFLARAEAEDRVQREQMMAMARGTTHPFNAGGYVRPNPHIQYASAAHPSPERSTSGTTAVQDRQSGDRSRRSSSRTRGREGSNRNSGQHYYVLSGTGAGAAEAVVMPGRPSNHPKRQSWSASYRSSDGEREGGLETQKKTAAFSQSAPDYGVIDWARRRDSQTIQQQQQPRAHKVATSTPAVHILEKKGEATDAKPVVERTSVEYQTQAQPPRTLRRQTSITQRIADYIRPARANSVGHHEHAHRPVSRTAHRRSGSHMPRTIGTLVE